MSMKTFIIDRYGRGARVRAGEMPDPVVREDDVLVQIHAAGVNLLDSKIRSGEFKLLLPYRLPLIRGQSGRVLCERIGRTGARRRASREPHILTTRVS
jgi:NADPH:quinone reductase-like Zn-dependent oxidoreductase